MSVSQHGQVPIAILGATGLVGQKAIAMVESHPLFYVSEVSASDAKSGKRLGEFISWKEEGEISQRVSELRLKKAKEIESNYILSALPAYAAKEIEPFHAQRGAFVFSNASAFRMDLNVPILIPEVNMEHLSLLENQNTKGKIITNSNCVVAFICLALKPLMRLGSIKNVSVMTMQAISGAGYLGVDCMDIMNNIIPYIKGEEEKIILETHKILGTATNPATFNMIVHAHRVPIFHGHTAVMHIDFDEEINLKEVRQNYLNLNLNEKIYQIYDQLDRPQPRDIGAYDQRVHIGRIKHGMQKNTIGLIAMGHNLVRGAAGGSLKNMERVVFEKVGSAL